MRATSKGLVPNQTLIRVRNACSRRHAHGTFVRLINDTVEYRSHYNGGVYTAPLPHVMIDHLERKFQNSIKARRNAR